MIGKILLFVLIFLTAGSAMAAEKNDCYTTYYKTKDAACIDALVKIMQAQPRGKPLYAPMGLLAHLFSTSPAERERIINQTPSHAKPMYLEVLFQAGLPEEARLLAHEHGWEEGYEKLLKRGLLPIGEIMSDFYPGTNDLLIGAYMASGDTKYIKNILANFTSADDDTVSDALRMSLMQSKFGPGLAPKERPPTMMLKACEKYECKKDMKRLMRVMTLSSAFWALRSLGERDEGIKNTYVQFFKKDTRLERLLAMEQNAFGNYLTTLIAHAGIKDNEGINASLEIYENLGSGKDAIDAILKSDANATH